MALYKEDLKDLKCDCGMPGCEGAMYFHGQCHPPAPTWVKYFDGILTVECCECGKVVAEFAIASNEEAEQPSVKRDLTEVELIEVSSIADKLDATSNEVYEVQLVDRVNELSEETGMPVPEVKDKVREYRNSRG